jgi:hypothetical protein
MTEHIDESTLHDFRDGLVTPDIEKQVREHIAVCPECREELEGLTSLLKDLGSLPVEAQPSRDLWPQIAWRVKGAGIQDPAGADMEDGREVPRRDSLEPRRSRRVSLPAWQLLAASIALMVVSGASVWTFLSGRADSGGLADPLPPTPVQFVGWEEAYSGYDEAVADLESVLERGREVRTIDLAIEEAGEAVRQDPASPILQRFLADNLRKKMDLLRKAAMAVYANT